MISFVRENRHALEWSGSISLAIWTLVALMAWTIPPWAAGTKVAVLVAGFVVTTTLGFCQLRRIWNKLENKYEHI